jgi:hypothetical protein
LAVGFVVGLLVEAAFLAARGVLALGFLAANGSATAEPSPAMRFLLLAA